MALIRAVQRNHAATITDYDSVMVAVAGNPFMG